MSTIVRTKQGQLRGIADGGIHRFLGLPYAAPTSGANRFRPPQQLQPWSGIRDADTKFFEAESRLIHDPRAWERDLWKDVR
ncbi:MAG: carboxylesterase type [Pseudarthrobacter sp.]|nr:carboxylesterase type [Pseudarthrobacter sp.]